MKLAYSTDESARKLRVQKFGSEDNAKNFYKNADNSKLMIDRMVDSASLILLEIGSPLLPMVWLPIRSIAKLVLSKIVYLEHLKWLIGF